MDNTDSDVAHDLDTADALHSAAIHLLRRLRTQDDALGLSAPRLSALSVVVFGGPVTITQLASAEQVSPATISRMVKEMEWEGLLTRERDPADGRVQRIGATEKGAALLQEGRRKRVAVLSEMLAALPAGERRLLGKAARLLERLTLPEGHPGQPK
ncbi:MAG TPA: MarR family transcriptional regulator [Gemmatimonadetes bacterium]|nr:MarR family transcriptional regulator [Gemmatimonadota bacterium]